MIGLPRHVLAAACCCAAMLAILQAQGPDRSKPPALAPPPPLKLPPIQTRTLSNGLAVWLMESHEVPIVQLSLVIRAGAAEDPPGRYGAATFTAAMLDEGAGSRSALEIADAVELLGGELTTGSSFDASAVRLNVPGQALDQGLPILTDVVMRPTFPEREIERLRMERLTTLLQARDDPSSIAGMAFARILFGPMHRYGTGLIGTETTLKGLTGNDFRTFHGAHYNPSISTLLVVGDVSGEAVIPKLERAFGQWKSTPAPRRAEIDPPPQPKARQVYVVDKPDAEQSQIRIGWMGVPRSSPDYFPLLVLNTVLGGSFTSRLNQNLRETHGYAYGASSAFDMRRSAGPFVAAAGVQTDKTAEALREFFNELEAIRKPIDATELAKAKNYIALGFPAEFETSTDLSRRLEELAVYGLPMNYYEEYIARVMAVTQEEVQGAAEKYIHPSQAVVVVVGDRKTIEPGVRALNLGPVTVMSVADAIGN